MAEVLASGKNAGERYLTSLKPQMEKMETAQKDLGEFQATQSEDEARRKAEQTRSKAASARQEAETIRTSPVSQDLGAVEQQLMDTTFIPTQDNAQDLAGLFSLVSVIGMAMGRGGKGDAVQAMNAMNGMLEGYQKGRGDLYKKEKDTFESKIKSLKTKSDILNRRLKEISELASRDSHAADLEADALFAEQGADFLKQYKQKFGLAATVEFQKQQLRAAEKAAELTETEIQKSRDRAAADARARLDREAKAEAAKAKASNTRGGAAQDTAIRVMQQDIGNAQYNLNDLKDLAEPTGKLPGGSVAFAQKFTGDLSSMILRYAANQNIDEGLQGMDALMLNTAFDIASAQSGGRGQLSDAKVRAIVSQMPLDEQPESTKATKWAALFTRVDEANKSMPEDKRVQIPQELRDYYMRGREKRGGDKVATLEDIQATMEANNLTYDQTVQKLKERGFKIKLDSAEGDY